MLNFHQMNIEIKALAEKVNKMLGAKNQHNQHQPISSKEIGTGYSLNSSSNRGGISAISWGSITAFISAGPSSN